MTDLGLEVMFGKKMFSVFLKKNYPFFSKDKD